MTWSKGKDMKKIFAETSPPGPWLLSDMCLYSSQYSQNMFHVISFYGTPREVTHMTTAIWGLDVIRTEDSQRIIKPYRDIRCITRAIGYSKRHCLMFDEKVVRNLVVWPEGGDKEEAIFRALSERKVPILKEWVPIVEMALVENEMFTPLGGWGLEGYEAKWDDDQICDLVYQKVFFLERGMRRRS